MGLDSLSNGLDNALSTVEGIVRDNTTAVVGSAVVVGAVGGAVITSVIQSKTGTSKSSKKKRAKIKHTKRGWKQDRARRSKQKWEIAYQKRKRKKKHHSHSKKRKGMHYTKNGQPYIILASGKARFVKKHRR